MSIKHIPFRKQAIRLVAVLMAAIYVFGLILTDFVHPLLHKQLEVVTHTAADERDPCHRAIYHGEKENDPAHHTHLIAADEKCWLCDVIFSHEHIKAEQTAFTEIKHIDYQKPAFLNSLYTGFHSLPCSRGPPAVA